MPLDIKGKWESLHRLPKFKPRYPNEIVVQFLFRNFDRFNTTRILDLGCGAGRHIVLMSSEGFDTYGTDISKEGIQHTQNWLSEKGFNATLEVTSVEKIPHEDMFFDGIVCFGVLYYCDSKQIKAAISEIYRTLKAGGKALVQVRSTDDYRYGQGLEIERNSFAIQESDTNKNSYNENGMIMHFFDRSELESLFNAFTHITIDKMIETHNNEEYCDSNYVVIAQK